DEEMKAKLYENIEKGEEIEQIILELSNSEGMDELVARKDAWEESVVEAIGHFDQGHLEQAMDIVEGELHIYEQLQEEANDLTINRENNILEIGKQAHTLANSTTIFVIVIAIVVLLIGVVTAIVTARTISRPIVKVMERMNQVAE